MHVAIVTKIWNSIFYFFFRVWNPIDCHGHGVTNINAHSNLKHWYIMPRTSIPIAQYLEQAWWKRIRLLTWSDSTHWHAKK